MKVKASRKASFNAAHRLYRPDWDEEKIEQATEIVKGGKDIPGKLAELGVNGLLVPSVIEYCRAITARSTHRQDFDREVQMVFSAQHPFVVQLHAAYQTRHHVYLVLDYCAGGDLAMYVRHAGKGGLPEPTAQFVSAEVLLALEYLHGEGVIHRDVKAENVLVDEQGHVRMIDMGLAARITKKQPKRRSRVPGPKPPARRRPINAPAMRQSGVEHARLSRHPGGANSLPPPL